MLHPFAEPTAANFDGTPEELVRFITARRLLAEDDLEFERRIDRSSSESFSGDG